MIGSLEERKVFEEIQKKLFYMIPEKWESIHFYAAIIEQPFKKPLGEMYFYYYPKGILKKDPINVYEIPALFNIDEQNYNELIDKLYKDIRKLRTIAENKHPNLWSNITITISNCKFRIEYDYSDLSGDDVFTDYERHVIWRYKNLDIDLDLETKQDRYIISKYLDYIKKIKNNSIARKVKIADLKHNSDLTRLDIITEYDLERKAKYTKALEILLND